MAKFYPNWLLLAWVAFLSSSSHYTWSEARRSTKPSECETLLASTLSLKERQELCDTRPGSVGPALCGQDAQSELSIYDFAEVLAICAGAESAAPVLCRKMLPHGRVRNENANALCGNSPTTLPGQCFMSLTQGLRRNDRIDNKDAVAFCKELRTDDASGALACAEAAVKTKLLKGAAALESCQDALGSRESVQGCVEYFAKQPRGGDVLSPKEAVRFCAESAATAPGDCFNATREHPSLKYSGLSAHDIADLCLYANSNGDAQGPARCMAYIQDSRKSAHRLSQEASITLCQGAASSGPAECFERSQGLASDEERLELCHGALTEGVADCYRRSKSVFRPEAQSGRTGGTMGDVGELRKHLCLSSTSSDPAECVSTSPHYLGNEERLQLCHGTPAGRSREPPLCLDRVATVFRRFRSANSMALGYFLANVLDDDVRQSRALLINMCSFGAMKHSVEGGMRARGAPLYAAECLAGAPTSMSLDDAVRMCTNAANVYMPQKKDTAGTRKRARDSNDADEEDLGADESTGAQPVNMCARMLPRDWTSAQVSALCAGSSAANRNVAITGAKVDAVVECITAVMGSTGSGRALGWGIRLSRDDAITLCRNEMPGAPVVTCARAAVKETSKRSQLIDVDLMVEVCGGAGALQTQIQEQDMAKVTSRSEAAGQCMGLISSDKNLAIAVGVASRVCFSEAPVAKVFCLQQTRSTSDIISIENAEQCATEVRRVKNALVSFQRAEDNAQHAVVGKWISLHVTLLDQWGQVFQAAGLAVVASLDARNAQGAVLWGVRSNVTDASGTTVLERIVVNQPGPVELRLHTPTPTLQHVEETRKQGGFFNPSGKAPERVLIAVMQLLVRRDTNALDPSPCMFIFRDATCPAFPGDGETADALYPSVRGNLRAAFYGRVLGCEAALKKWHVDHWFLADGQIVLQHRAGVESIWTGTRFPSQEQTPEERLELPGLTEKLITVLQSLPGRRSTGTNETTTAAESAGAAEDEDKKKKGKYNKKGKDEYDIKERSAAISPVKASRQIKAATRELRRAYYRKSLMWHPDRWAGMPIYSEAVQGAFQLITDAYSQLMRLSGDEVSSASAKMEGASSMETDAVYA